MVLVSHEWEFHARGWCEDDLSGMLYVTEYVIVSQDKERTNWNPPNIMSFINIILIIKAN